MRIILRIISLLLAIGVFYTAWFALWFCASGRLNALLRAGLLGFATFFGWGLVLLVGPYAAVQLWRFRPSGLYTTAALLALVVAYYFLGAAIFHTPDAPLTPIIVSGVFNALLLAVVLSPSARRVCRESRAA